MKSGKKRNVSVEKPAIEVVVRSGDDELALVAFFADGLGGFDVLVAVHDPLDRDSYVAALQAATDGVREAAFSPLGSARAPRHQARKKGTTRLGGLRPMDVDNGDNEKQT